jgi:hypothetical protein
MPFVEIWVEASTAYLRRTIAWPNAVHAALQSVFEVPAGESLQPLKTMFLFSLKAMVAAGLSETVSHVHSE